MGRKAAATAAGKAAAAKKAAQAAKKPVVRDQLDGAPLLEEEPAGSGASAAAGPAAPQKDRRLKKRATDSYVDEVMKHRFADVTAYQKTELEVDGRDLHGYLCEKKRQRKLERGSSARLTQEIIADARMRFSAQPAAAAPSCSSGLAIVA
eukprot:9941503-Lingulodinium_polyedra.AAC.1